MDQGLHTGELNNDGKGEEGEGVWRRGENSSKEKE